MRKKTTGRARQEGKKTRLKKGRAVFMLGKGVNRGERGKTHRLEAEKKGKRYERSPGRGGVTQLLEREILGKKEDEIEELSPLDP